MTSCPFCKNEMKSHDELGHLCNTGDCPLYQVWFNSDDIRTITETIAATRFQALQEAREMVNRYLSERHNEWDMAGLAAEFDELCSLAAQPAAAPACPNCGVTGQMSGPGTAALCMACGVVTG